MNIAVSNRRDQRFQSITSWFALTIFLSGGLPLASNAEEASHSRLMASPFEQAMESKNWQEIPFDHSGRSPAPPPNQNADVHHSELPNIVRPTAEIPMTTLPARPPRYEIERFDNVNIAATYAADAWIALDPTRFGPKACLVINHQNPEIMIMLVAERLGTEVVGSSATVATISRLQLRRSSPEIWCSDEIPAPAAGMTGLEFQARLSKLGQSLYWVNWVVAHNGYAYQVLTFGSAEFAVEVKEAAREFRSRLQLIDPLRVAHVESDNLVGCYQSPTFNYRLDLTGLGWMSAKEAANALHVDFAAFNGLGSTISIMATPMIGKKPDLERLKTVMLAAINFGKSGDEIVKTSACRIGGLDGLELEVRGGPDGEKNQWFFWVLANERVAYLISCRVLVERPEAMSAVREAINRFTVLSSDPINESELTPSQRDCSALILNELGLRYFSAGDLASARDYFQNAVRLSPANHIFAENYVEVLDRLDCSDEALAFLAQHAKGGQTATTLRAQQAKLLLKRGNSDAAKRAYAALFAEGYADETDLLNYLRACTETQSYDEALRAVEQVQKRKPTAVLQTWQAVLYGMQGDHAKSIAMLKELWSNHPADIDIALELIEAYDRAKQFDTGLEVAQRLIDSGNNSEAVLIAQGRVYLRLERAADAKRVFEQVLQSNPKSAAASELLAIASSQLGEGQNSCVKTVIEPVDTPPSIASMIERAPPSDQSLVADSGAEILSHVVGFWYQPGKPLRKSTTERVRISSPAGVKSFSTLIYKFDAVSERIYVNRLVVADQSGTRVAEGSVENYYVVDDTTSGEVSNARVLKIPVPGLTPGATLEYTVTRESVAPAKEFGFDEFSLACVLPCRMSAYFVQGDIDSIKAKASQGVQIQRTGDLLYAAIENPAPLRYEPYQPSADTFTPMVWVGPATADWNAEAQEYLKSIEDRLQLDEQTRMLAARLTQTSTSNNDKLAAIVEHVQQAYTYHAIEFGRRARIPNKAAKTISLQYGDCKDHALLAKQLLAAVGIESHLALVRYSSHVVDDFPSLDQFDHMVLYVPQHPNLNLGTKNAGMIIDATSKDADPFLDPPYGLSEKEILVLDPSQPHFIHTAKLPVDAGQLVSKRTLTFDFKPSGTVDSHIAEDVTLNSYLAPSVRGFLKRSDINSRREAIQNLLSQNGAVRVKRIEATNLEAVRQPLQIHMEYIVPNSFHAIVTDGTQKSLLGSLPCAWESEILLTQALDRRTTPFEITTPKLIRSSLEICVPDGFEFAGVDQCSGAGQSRFRAWSSKAAQVGSNVRIEYAARVVAGQHPAREYEAYYSDLNEALAVLQTPIVLHSRMPLETARRPTTINRVR